MSAGSLKDRLAPPLPSASLWGWGGPLLVTLFGGFLRFCRLSTPPSIIFDETYYASDAYGILRYGVEMNKVKNADAVMAHGNTHILATGARFGGEYVVHPPLGKILIAAGEWMFGLTPFGWRFAVALIGTLSILLTARITRRLTRCTLLGCVAGLLMAVDGLELVLSRTAILDIFVMFWVLAAFGMLVLDRDAARTRIADAAEAASDAELACGGPKLGIRWRRVLAGVFLGCACATKWDGVWYILAFGALAIAWDLGARRAAGYRDRVDGVLRDDVKWLPVTFGLIPFATYLASWSGWFASKYGYNRNWAAANGGHIPVRSTIWSATWSALDSLYQYHREMYGFALGLHDQTGYVSRPWSWLILSRPVSFFWTTPKGCGGTCAQEVLAIGTPAIWWASIPALLFCLGWWITRREWRSGALLLAVAAGWLPWFWFAWRDNRTEYYFYAIVFLPYLVMAITLGIGVLLGSTAAAPGRRAVGAIIAGAYLLLVLINFAYLYPVLAGQPIPHAFWQQRMWFSGWI